MNKYLSNALLFTLFLLLNSGSLFSQEPPVEGSTKKNKSKDAQNQTEFLKPDMEQKDFNLNDRKAISRPQMPKYDVSSDSAAYMTGKAKEKQQEAFLNNKYYYPAKPKNQWEIGFGVGSFLISGDVKPVLNPLKSFGGTFTVRKSFGYILSARLQYVYGQAQGRDWEPKSNSKWNGALNGFYNSDINYFKKSVTYNVNGRDLTAKNLSFKNFKTQVHEVSLQAVFTLGNLRFHRERNKINTYLFLGAGGMFYSAKTDALDANGQMYDFGPALSKYYSGIAGASNDKNAKKETTTALKNIYDGKFESNAEGHQNEEGIKSFTFNPSYSIGLGLGFHASKRVTFNLESRVTMTNDDLLDGERWLENAWDGHTRDFDNYFYTFVTCNIHLGKKALEPMWWLNPMDYTYKKLGEMDPDRIINELIADDDEDGVPNKMDKDPKTKKGCPVDTKGIALDSDKDGIADCDDKEPYSPPGCPIDATGVAKCPSCCDNLPTQKGGGSGYDCSKVELPSVFFQEDKYGVNPEYYAHLHEVADKLQMCPDAKIVVTGINGEGKYGEQISWNRVNKAIDYMTTKYGVSRDRFIVQFKQGEKAVTPQQKMEQRRVEFKVAQDGVTGNSNPPAPHPGLKAGREY
jgi:outer membrane protein OmpA-like peptidoglycan-associated protein